MSWTDGVARQVLPNGLTLLVQREASAPVVAVVTHVRAGYFDEPAEWVGISHVLEHMYFKGTARRPPGAIARETQRAGGYINAGTIYDKTVYYTVLPAAGDGLERALDIQADALMHAALDPGELARELEVIVQEANRKLDSPSAVTIETLYATLFRAHPMRRWRIGTEQGLRRLTPADVRRYYETRYTPDRVIVGIAGDVDPARALRLAEHTYGEWRRAPAAVARWPAEPPGREARLRVLRGDLQRPLAALGWRTVGALHPDRAALDVAAAVLGAGRGSRLYRGVRLPGLASSATASHYTPADVGVLEVLLESGATQLDRAVTRSVELAAGLAAVAPAAAELDRVRALEWTSWARRFETADGRASALCEGEALGDYRFAETLCRRLLAVEADDVRRVAAEYLEPGAASAVLHLPDSARSALEHAPWPPAVRAVQDAAAADAGAVRASVRAPGGGTSAVHAGEVHRRSHDAMDLLVRARRGSGLVSVGLLVPGVRAGETEATAGISALLARTALRGAGGLSAEQLAGAAERLGGGIAPHVGADAVGWWLTARAGAARDAAQLLRLVALEPTLAEQDVGLERALQASDARRTRDDMFRHPVQRVLGEAFRGDAYGLPVLGEPETVAALGGEQVRAWAEALRGRRGLAVAVGALDPAALLAALEPLADWPGNGAPPASPATPWCGGRDGEMRRKAQTAFAMAFPAPPAASADRYPLLVLASLLSGLAGRLFDELREKRSLAYTVAAVPWLARRAGALLTYIATAPAREDEAREAMLAELARVRAEPVTPDELERARNYTAGAFEVREQRGAAVAADIADAWLHGTLDELAATPARLRAVTAEDVRRVAEDVLAVERRAEYVVRGKAEGGTGTDAR